MFGEDANWGRILCAIGYADAEFDINKVDVDLASSKGTIAVCRNAAGVDFSEEKAKEILEEDEIYINIDLHQGCLLYTSMCKRISSILKVLCI